MLHGCMVAWMHECGLQGAGGGFGVYGQGYPGGCLRIAKNDKMNETGEYKIRSYLRPYHCYCSGFLAIVGAILVIAREMAISHSRTGF